MTRNLKRPGRGVIVVFQDAAVVHLVSRHWRPRAKLSLHATRSLTQTMSNFGAGQGLFGNNQNKNQGSATPGSTPAAGASGFGGFGSNTTSGSAFGGAGAGNTPGGGGTASAPTGSVFGTGGGAFGSGGNTNTSTSTPSGAGTGGGLFGGPSLFAGVYASCSVLMKLPHASTTQQILRQIQGLRRQRQGAGCSQMQVRSQVLPGRQQDNKVYLEIPPAQLRGAGLEVRTN